MIYRQLNLGASCNSQLVAARAFCGGDCTDVQLCAMWIAQYNAQVAANAQAGAIQWDIIAAIQAEQTLFQANYPIDLLDERLFQAQKLSSEDKLAPIPPPCRHLINNSRATNSLCSVYCEGSRIDNIAIENNAICDNSKHTHCCVNRTTGIIHDDVQKYYSGGTIALCNFDVNCLGHRKTHGCFAPDSMILMADGSTKPI